MIKETVVEAVVKDMQECFLGNESCFSETRDIFTARLQSYVLDTKKYLESAIIGEIGNNTFDHNFGFINNYPRGVYCNMNYLQRYIVLADYGKGLKQSLLPVLPSLASDMEAIETAFTKRISGRSPEQRGNGLKFVAETIQQNNWRLYFQSGVGSCSIDVGGLRFDERPIFLTGCLVIIDFSEEN
jgi:hypothetical protein